MMKLAQHSIAEVPRRQPRVAITIGIDLGDVWSHYCTLYQDGEVVDRGHFRTTPKAIDTWFTDVPHARVAMEAGTHSIWISEQLQELGHEVIVANFRELRAISHSDRKSDQINAEKLACYARLDPEILLPIAHRTLPGTWDPRNLPRLRNPNQISRSSALLEGAFTVVLVVWWVVTMASPVVVQRAGMQVLLAPVGGPSSGHSQLCGWGRQAWRSPMPLVPIGLRCGQAFASC